jgi:hypothetical protein
MVSKGHKGTQAPQERQEHLGPLDLLVKLDSQELRVHRVWREPRVQPDRLVILVLQAH